MYKKCSGQIRTDALTYGRTHIHRTKTVTTMSRLPASGLDKNDRSFSCALFSKKYIRLFANECEFWNEHDKINMNTCRREIILKEKEDFCVPFSVLHYPIRLTKIVYRFSGVAWNVIHAIQWESKYVYLLNEIFRKANWISRKNSDVIKKIIGSVYNICMSLFVLHLYICLNV